MLRFAISPTKDLNINNLRVAIFNYLVSKQKNEAFVIRIDDTNKETNIEGKDKEILDYLNLFSMEHERVVHQSEAVKYHQSMAMQLLTNKKAFVCYCGDDKLEELKQKALEENKIPSYDGFCENLSDELVLNTNSPFTVRIKKPEAKIEFTDALNGQISQEADEVDSLIILNHDKSPTYNYACAVDDMILDASTIIRDEKYLLDTAKQIHIRQSLSYDKKIDYIHIPSLTNELTIKELIDEGFLPSAIANYLVLLGNEVKDEIFTLEEAINWFDINKVSKENLDFDLEKLKEINKKHLEGFDEMRLSKILGFADADIGKLAKLFLDELSTIKELKASISSIFSTKSTFIGLEEEFVELKLCLNDAPYFDNLEDLKTYISENTNLSSQNLDKTLEYILTGRNENMDIAKIYPLIKNYLGEIIK